MANTNIGLILSASLGAPTAETEAGYTAKEYTVIENVTSLPDIGGEADVASYDPMETGIKVKEPAVVDYGSGTIEVAFEEDSAGHEFISDAFDGDGKGLAYSFQLEHKTGRKLWFVSKVYSFKYIYGSTGAIIGAQIKIEIDTKLTKSA